MSPASPARDFSDFGPPRRVAGGVRARSTRGAIGRSWWSRRFLDVLESFALGTRLTRGRSYARAGQVLSVDVAPGRVSASVQGSRPAPYRVTIGLRPFPEPLWARIEALLAAQALFSARLLAGDLPPELEQVFAEAGAPLFPAGVAELAMSCDCPDFAVPCKHLAATFYLLAEAFDADPFQLLHWRGRARTALLARLRELRTGETPARATAGASHGGATTRGTAPGRATTRRGRGTRAGAVAATVAGVDAAADTGSASATSDVLDGLPQVPLAEAVDRFWLPPVPLPERAPTLPTEPDLLLRQLGPPGAALGGPGLTERLRRAYERFAAQPD
ncbi:SWIM zinc finger family protein [Micromonospora sp. NPDC049559]|uniref:SWIM zinc finger family protein n=1 Tax=Micromonospora sp. NPDC049559 TaxID=3155923 RepID=UPI003415D4BE